MENNNPIGNLMRSTMENVKDMLRVDTVVGDPIVTPDGITLVPISKISVGFGGGGVEFLHGDLALFFPASAAFLRYPHTDYVL